MHSKFRWMIASCRCVYATKADYYNYLDLSKIIITSLFSKVV